MPPYRMLRPNLFCVTSLHKVLILWQIDSFLISIPSALSVPTFVVACMFSDLLEGASLRGSAPVRASRRAVFTTKADQVVEKDDNVAIHYVGTLPNGTEFDASRPRGQPLAFTVGRCGLNLLSAVGRLNASYP